MTDIVNAWLAKQKAPHKPGSYHHSVLRHIICGDGTTLSVQASRTHYCTPQDDIGPWSTVEVWCIEGPNGKPIYPRSFGLYKNGPYAFVPIETVAKFIKRHGGIAA